MAEPIHARKPIRVLHIRADESPANPIAGAAVVIRGYLLAADPARVDARLLVLLPDRATAPVLRAYYALPPERAAFIDDFSSRDFLRPSFWRGLARAVRQQRIDVLHAHGYKADFIALVLKALTGRKVVSTVHGYNPASARLKSRLIWVFYRRIWHLFDRTVLVSPAMLEVDIFRRLDARGKVTVIPNAIPAPEVQALPGPGEPFTLLSVGRLAYEKNHILLLEALALIPPERRPRVWIVGEGPERPALEAYIAQHHLGPWAQLLGYRAPAEVEALYRQSRALVIPSLFETFSIVLLEAMGRGLPVIAADFGELHTALEGGAGLLFERGSAAALAASITRAVQDPALLARAREAALARFRQRYSLEASARILNTLYDPLVTP